MSGNKNLKICLAMALLIPLIPCLAGAKIIYVDNDGPSDFNNIQSLIDDSNDGDTIIVADGIYRGDGNRDIDFSGKAITLSSENGPENCFIDCQGTEANPHRGFYFHSHEDANSVLDGFTITNGYSRGGGVYIYDSSPMIKNCIISNNTADHGGGIDSEGGSAEITNCIIKSNSSLRGGGVCSFSNAKINNCIISNNYASGDGGGGIYGSKLRITNCVIAENSTGIWSHGGGITAHYTTGDNIITNCTVINNSAGTGDGYGGGIHPYCSNTTITNCIVYGNSAKHGNQIAMWAWGSATANVSYCNVQGGASAVYFNQGCILNWGPGNIDYDPCFAFNSDYHLMSDSLCINAGNPNYIAEPDETDLDGNPRIIGGRIDMGAYEYNPSTPSIALSSSSFKFCYTQDGPKPYQILLMRNCGGKALHWEIIEDCNWFQATPTSGVSTEHINEVTLTVEPNALTAGSYSCNFSVLDPNATNSPKTVKVDLDVLGEIVYVPSQFPTIQDAIDHVAEGGIVVVADGVYTGERNCSNNLGNKAITIRSENGPKECVIDCGRRFWGFRMNDNQRLEGFTICNGYAGIFCDGNSTVFNCIIVNNTGDGAIRCSNGSATITNCIISGNSSQQHGGGIYCSSGNPTIINCSITGNSAQHGGGIYILDRSNVTITNSILWNNTALYGPQLYLWSHSNASVDYTDTEGGKDDIYIGSYSKLNWGPGNINSAPHFIDPGYYDANELLVDGDYHLKSQAGRWDANSASWVKDDITSPCIDAGDPASPIGLEPFPNGGIINMGAYGGTAEASKSYFGEPPCETIVAGDINGDCKVDFKDFAIMALHWLDDNNP